MSAWARWTLHALPPLAHIFIRSKQAWIKLDDGAPAFDAYYDAATTWPAASLTRYEAARACRAEEAKVLREQVRKRT